MTDIEWESRGEAAVDSLFMRIRRRATDMRPIFSGVAEAFADMESRLFASEGSSGGRTWAPLSPSYSAWKVSRGRSGQILVDTGRLRRSLTQRPFGHEVITPQRFEFGTDVPYAVYHQQGTSKMPARPPVQSDEIFESEVARMLGPYIVDGIYRT